MFPPAKILVLVVSLLLLLQFHHHTCTATNNSCISSCANVSIAYPFRLKTHPKHCGHKDLQLVCQNNLLHLYLFNVHYFVQAINYNNATIRLVEADFQRDNCSSLPRHSVSRGEPFHSLQTNYPYSLFDVFDYRTLLFITCANPLPNSPLYIHASPCIYTQFKQTGSAPYSYVRIGAPPVLDFPDSCHIDLVYPISLPLNNSNSNLTYLDVYHSLAYGFELSWLSACCQISPDHQCQLRDVWSSCAVGFPELGNIREFASSMQSMLSIFLDALPIFPSGFVQFVLGGKLIHSEPWVLRIYVLAILRYCFSVIVLLRAILFFIGFPVIIIFLIYKWRRRHLSMYYSIEEFLQSHANLMPVRYSYSDLKKITTNFKYKLGEGGYGCVYRGKLRSGRLVAVKILGKSKADGQEFINEVATIGRIHHVNVVQLIGFCVEGLKQALIYELMPNGSLDKHIFYKEGSIPISVEKMYDISLGIARGIEYLHRGCHMQILHFDIKPHNVLLDEKFTPKVADFGLAKLHSKGNSIVSLTAAKGTLGYMAPELFYKHIGGVSHKADVYSYGMLLMEMAARRRNFNDFTENSSQVFFPLWIHHQYSEGNEIEMEDATEEERKTTKKMFIVALWCIQLKPDNRPSMHQVIDMLEEDVQSLQMPPKPSLWAGEDDALCATNSTGSTSLQSGSLNSFSLTIDAD
ncbi:LEAF RUST 10 DISEASE-RESISTANCE LOCUS RECEPTOR-LIKE PROTEIN KINASE-like 2.7 isoform X2 [Ricinus communis]|uniref:LEAF RUST 10 DISEASE-RESISTANCE LOCUS RECEPTOR-LIKE PROTEIN KINASE-like 2.7 isoform X2 n=1 Tax=Ricinus communis TaxID=3988 RepID=UPI0007721F1B|nr:LEAF RUST 10 DISEASE-RESISTANCE LOCUS RECEPTOR-LIKE PROTEIN KINASE-like 2.7 isoform X2 [Ricinus communis]|eukprot:XP_015572235.1 LEAF RUST 10 DISEASE-RESISTANCE LOCUS RECEPTOR-LIKE PROTEIN KINASE-like 2.7 isoform X2 [Ricinus communis]